MKVIIDPGAGPCFGVVKAIEKAEEFLMANQILICNGDLIHNDQELKRLENLGMRNLSIHQAYKQHKKHILFRAHGEPPASYDLAKKYKIDVTDTTCPIVKTLQNKINQTYENIKNTPAQIVIFGAKNHAEIISLQGHCQNTAVIIGNPTEVEKLEISKPIYLFSQTTKYHSNYLLIKKLIEEKILNQNLSLSSYLYFHNSSCKIVAQRDKQLQEFIKNKDLVLFVSGSKSSNGKELFQICKSSGIPSYFVESAKELQKQWFIDKENIGISGATSTPLWLLEEVEKFIKEISIP